MGEMPIIPAMEDGLAKGLTSSRVEKAGVESSGRRCAKKSGRGLPVGVLFRGIVYGGTGYAEEAWMVALALANHGIPTQLAPVGSENDDMQILPSEARRLLSRLHHERVDLAQSVFYQTAMAYMWNLDAYARYRIGRTTFETDRIPDGWAERCNAMDEVWVPCEFNRNTFASAGVDPDKLRVVHEGLDAQVFRPGMQPLDIPHRRGFNFLSVFDLHDRKGFDLLLKAYLREFKPDEDVTLILKVSQHCGQLADAEAQLTYFIEKEVGLTLEKSPPVIMLKKEFLSQANMARLYAAADAFVLPTHGEGCGRPFLEALACEVPVIATRWSGQLDFLNDENSYLIDIEGLVPASTEFESFAGHLWAQPSVEHLRQLMRDVYSHPEEARDRAKRGRQLMLEHWDWSVTLPRWINEFQRLLG
ncbi:MAG TPA: glycosyltransferase [Terriglobia bacterium]|nr:glycosyltransferase [Terriglobia bacterium]